MDFTDTGAMPGRVRRPVAASIEAGVHHHAGRRDARFGVVPGRIEEAKLDLGSIG
ncbi:MAG: hypothetical protein ACLPWS_16245 [Rhodomicrobium sp.]